MHRTLAGVTGVAAAALALTACSNAIDTGTGGGTGGTGSTAAPAGQIARPASCDSDKPLLAVALPNLTNPYYVAMKQGFEQEAAAKGFSVNVQIADDDDANQLAQVQSQLQQQPCALALNAVKSEPAAALVAAANQAGVPVFTVNVTVDPAAMTAQNASIVQYLGADNVAGGKQMGEQMLADLGADADVQIGLVTEPDEVPTRLRDQGFEEAIAANPKAKVVATVDGNVKPDDSLRATSEMLSGNPDIDVVFASTGPAAYGALQGLPAGSPVKVYGFCAADQPLTATYPACVAQEPERYGRLVVQQVRGWLDGTPPQPEILESLKLFKTGETPGPGQVG